MLLPPFEPHWQARTGCSRFRTLSPTSQPASTNRWCFLARTRPPSRISILAARPPLAAWSCKPNSGTLTPGLNAMGSCCQKIAGRFTASGQTIVMGKRRSCRQNGPSYGDRDACFVRSFDQYCDFSRQYDPNPSPAALPNGTRVPPYNGPGMSDFIREFGRFDLLDYSACAF